MCLFVALTLGAVLASTAAATSPAWFVAGKTLKTGEKEAVADTTSVKTAFVIKGSGFGVECKTVQLEKSSLEGENKGAATIVDSHCTDITQEDCAVATIKTRPLSVLLEGTVKSLKLNFSPTTGKEVTTVNLSGGGCTLTEVRLEGTMACNYPGVETEAFEHELEFTAGSGTKLKAFGLVAEFTGLDGFWLASGKKWSAM
jgi:hypothetical protein